LVIRNEHARAIAAGDSREVVLVTAAAWLMASTTWPVALCPPLAAWTMEA
jgi:hypothetical protein